MKRLMAFFKRRPIFCTLLAAAVLMTAFSGVQTSRAALTTASNNYQAQLVTDTEIHAALLENGTVVTDSAGVTDPADPNSRKTLLNDLVPSGQTFHLGQNYDEALTVKNTGSIDEYVRVIVYRYWTDANGKKLTNLDPALIQIGFKNGADPNGALSPLGTNGWVLDPAASASKERVVLYYSKSLEASDTTSALMDTLRISGDLADRIIKTETTTTEGDKTYTTITASYPYENMTFVLEVEVDCVQTHNAEAAIQSAWGAEVSIDETTGELSLS